jgi:hypothetical protein
MVVEVVLVALEVVSANTVTITFRLSIRQMTVAGAARHAIRATPEAAQKKQADDARLDLGYQDESCEARSDRSRQRSARAPQPDGPSRSG